MKYSFILTIFYYDHETGYLSKILITKGYYKKICFQVNATILRIYKV